MKIVLTSLLSLIFSVVITDVAFANRANPIQMMCETKAKEVAQTTYTSCIQENRTAELEKIKREYQAKNAQLKSYYEKRIKALSLKSGSSKNKAIDADQETKPLREEVTENFKNEIEQEPIRTETVKSENSIESEMTESDNFQ